MLIRRYGDRAVLVECPDKDAHAVANALAEQPPSGVQDIVPAETSVLVVFSAPGQGDGQLQAIRDRLAAVPREAASSGQNVVSIPVHYDGPDLAEISDLTGLSVAGIIERHHRPTYVVSFIGFIPGFAYLSGLDESLVVPRRTDPRPSVPAGSVAIAGERTAVYPRSTPGGWRLVGRTAAELFDVTRNPPALLSPGTAVRFRPT